MQKSALRCHTKSQDKGVENEGKPRFVLLTRNQQKSNLLGEEGLNKSSRNSMGLGEGGGFRLSIDRSITAQKFEMFEKLNFFLFLS